MRIDNISPIIKSPRARWMSVTFSLLVGILLVFSLGSCQRKSVSTTTSYTPKSGTSSPALRQKIVSEAKKYVGSAYLYGGKKPSSGFDCSGYTAYVFNKYGIQLPPSSNLQAEVGRRVKIESSKPGDLVFFGSNGRISHVAIVVENAPDQLKVIHSTTSRGVKIDDVWNNNYWRPLIKFVNNVID